MVKKTTLIKLLNNRALQTLLSLTAVFAVCFVLIGSLFAYAELITIKECSILFFASAIVLIAQLMSEHYRETLTD